MSGRVGSITTGIITDGLVFNMDAANRASYPKNGTIITDTVNSLTGTINGASFETIDNGVFSFDGTDDYIQTNYTAGNGLSLFTVSVWFKVSDASISFSPLVSSRINSIGSSRGFDIYVGNNGTGVLTGRIYQNGGTLVNSGNIIGNDEWNYATIMYNGSTLSLYHNNTFIGSITANYSTSNANIVLGRWNASVSQTFLNGNIANTQIYNRALSSAEVLHNYNALKGRFGL
jgi:hypothetical protein